jgi:hypothetical protein
MKKSKKIIFMDGEKEDTSFTRKLYKRFKGDKTLIIVRGAGHYINKKYESEIKKMI